MVFIVSSGKEAEPKYVCVSGRKLTIWCLLSLMGARPQEGRQQNGRTA